MTRARELANFADNTAGLESLTVADITDLTATAAELNKLDGVTVSTGNINSAINQIIDSSTDLNVDSNTLVVDKSANRVGIGRTDPQTTLDIAHSGSSNSGALRIGDPSTISSSTSIYMRTTGDAVIGTGGGDIVFDTNIGSAERMRIDHSTGNVGINETSPNHKLVVEGNIQIGDWQTSGSRYIGYARADNSSFGTAGASGLEIESASIGGNYSQHLHFWTHFYNGGSGRRMTIRHNGRVGIGTEAPQQHFEVHDSGGLAYILINGGGGDGTTTSALQLGGRSASGGNALAQVSAIRGGDTTGQLVFSVKSAANTITERMRIDSSGNMQFRGSAAPITFMGGHTPYTGTYTQTGIYTNQNNNTDDPSNGIFIERRRLADNSSGEISNFTIGSRGGQSQFIIDPVGQIRHGVTGGNRISQSRWYNVGSNFSGNLYLRTPIVKNSSNMFRIKIFLYEYSGSYAGEYVFSGYAYSGSTLINTKVHVIAGSRTISIGVNSSNYVYCQINGAAGYYTHCSYDYIGWANFRPDQFYFSGSSG